MIISNLEVNLILSWDCHGEIKIVKVVSVDMEKSMFEILHIDGEKQTLPIYRIDEFSEANKEQINSFKDEFSLI